MRRGWLWGGFAVLLFSGIGASLYPDWQMRQELRGAEADGLALKPLPVAKVAPSDDVEPLFEVALKRHPTVARALFSAPIKPNPEIDALAHEFGEAAARRKGYAPSGIGHNVELVATVARYAARRSKDEGDLFAAARIAGSLKALPGFGGTVYWAKAASGVLDGADRLHLKGDARRRVVVALGPAPDPREILRHHMAENLAMSPGWSPNRRWWDRFGVFQVRRDTRYVALWRVFWQKAPPDDAGFVRKLGEVEKPLRDMEMSMGRYSFLPAVFGATQKSWSQWYERLSEVRMRMQKEGEAKGKR